MVYPIIVYHVIFWVMRLTFVLLFESSCSSGDFWFFFFYYQNRIKVLGNIFWRAFFFARAKRFESLVVAYRIYKVLFLVDGRVKSGVRDCWSIVADSTHLALQFTISRLVYASIFFFISRNMTLGLAVSHRLFGICVLKESDWFSVCCPALTSVFFEEIIRFNLLWLCSLWKVDAVMEKDVAEVHKAGHQKLFGDSGVGSWGMKKKGIIFVFFFFVFMFL